jgi:hypothetical protein
LSDSDQAGEIAEWKLRCRKAEADLGRLAAEMRAAKADGTLAESAARIARHARDALSAEVAHLRRQLLALSVLLSTLPLLLRQLEAKPDEAAWGEAREIAVKAAEAVAKALAWAEGEEVDEPDTDPEIEPPPIRALDPTGPAPYPRSPSAIMPRPPTIKQKKKID